MIKAIFYYDEKERIIGFELKGHAGYDEFGYDIVCSAVTSNSVAVINSLDSLLKVSPKKIVAEDGNIILELFEKDIEKSQLLLRHLRLTLEEISKEYPKNIKIFEK